MRQRTLGAICLEDKHYFMSLTSGGQIIRHRWTPLPMPEEAIARVSEIGRRQGMPSTLAFSNRHGAEIMDQVTDVVEDPHPDISDDNSTYSYHSSASESRDDISFAASDYHDDTPALTADPAIDANAPPPFPAATGVTDIGQDLPNADDMSDESSGVDDDNESSGVDDVPDDLEKVVSGKQTFSCLEVGVKIDKGIEIRRVKIHLLEFKSGMRRHDGFFSFHSIFLGKFNAVW
ncbi:hypothetical protein IV203_019597 [Nitzschia inconspicua]|uniref:Uncharacterized protein n=1 Tax=Nitzschia inconspicua TaxID=303405 RepID=A0A9K3LZF0_9STRA|nr:hypothetical protein IV203_019597 [Nitzschia inconspicua]